jgi:hypothetical protein
MMSLKRALRNARKGAGQPSFPYPPALQAELDRIKAAIDDAQAKLRIPPLETHDGPVTAGED